MILKDIPRNASFLTEYEANQIKPKIGVPAQIVEIEDLQSERDRFVIQYGKIEKKEFIAIGFVI
tara:strand:+ start:200 stop:391 length:192 start_codon:yes stop_codon:yes gene_type:complete